MEGRKSTYLRPNHLDGFLEAIVSGGVVARHFGEKNDLYTKSDLGFDLRASAFYIRFVHVVCRATDDIRPARRSEMGAHTSSGPVLPPDDIIAQGPMESSPAIDEARVGPIRCPAHHQHLPSQHPASS